MSRKPSLTTRSGNPASGTVVILGFGTIGQCVLPLLLDRLNLPARCFRIVDRIDPPELFSAFRDAGVTYLERSIDHDNLGTVLAEITAPGDMLINLTVGIESLAVADWCHRHGVAYVDTALEPWEGYVDDSARPTHERTEYTLHQRARQLAAGSWSPNGPTAVFTHGANPGLVSHFAKAALIEVARGMDLEFETPRSRAAWARLAQRTGTKIIHISERDTQVASRPKQPGEFVNTWSIPGFIEEAMMPVELGWGTHEREMPGDARRQKKGPRNTIYIDQPAARFLLYSWVPSNGQFLGLAIPHSETVTLSDYLTVPAGPNSARGDRASGDRASGDGASGDGASRDGANGDGACAEAGERHGNGAAYRPTVSFVYLPCDSAFASLHETMMSGWQAPDEERIIKREVLDGHDELGVLLLGHGLNGLWYGSRLDIHEARRIVPYSNATALQVAAGVVAAAMWTQANPRRGFCEPEHLPHDFVLEAARPYLGRLLCEQTDWTPLRQRPFIDRPTQPSDPWQFANFRPAG